MLFRKFSACFFEKAANKSFHIFVKLEAYLLNVLVMLNLINNIN